MSKAKVNKSEVIRKLHDDGCTVKEIKARTKYSDPLIRIVIRNIEKKREKYSKKENKRVMINLARRKDGAIIDLDKGGEVISPPDPVNKPPHYTVGGVDFLDYAEAKGLTENAYLFNVVKYVSRAGKKLGADPVQDLQKAEFYLKREIERRKSA